ncbi:hypothetical protein HYW83_04120 [Candidatus Peregrinibacteria bacterium]|nr:hypothetical protein [Candidatus Peregrinibacteria bacterium]
MQKILITGSLAYDQLTNFQGVFQDALSAQKSNHLSIAFPVINKQIFFGGCAGNIVYNAKLLEEDFILLGIAGKDFHTYEKWLQKNKINTSHVIRENRDFTSEASVVTDLKSQQITVFYPGAASLAKKHSQKIKQTISRLAPKLVFAHIAPNDRHFMLACIDACRQNKIPYFFDPGQAMSLFSAAELRSITKHAFGLFLNECELGLLSKLLKLNPPQIAQLCTLMIVTLGEKGSDIYFQKKKIHIPSRKPKIVKDPTGCGDAYRAGFLANLASHFPNLTPNILERAGKSGTKLAMACLQSLGTQNHKFHGQSAN